MGRLSAEDWASIRAEYETGASANQLSRKYGVDPAAISRRKKAEAWSRDVSCVIDRKSEAKVNGIVNDLDAKKLDEAIDAAADTLAKIKRDQRRRVDEALVEWEDMRRHGTFEDGKKVKIFAESLKILHEEQRKAYGIADKDAQDKKDKVYKVVLADEEQEF